MSIFNSYCSTKFLFNSVFFIIFVNFSIEACVVAALVVGANVVGAAAIINRSSSDLNLGVPFSALGTVSLPTYQPNVCPQCIAGTLAVKPGSRQS